MDIKSLILFPLKCFACFLAHLHCFNKFSLNVDESLPTAQKKFNLTNFNFFIADSYGKW